MESQTEQRVIGDSPQRAAGAGTDGATRALRQGAIQAHQDYRLSQLKTTRQIAGELGVTPRDVNRYKATRCLRACVRFGRTDLHDPPTVAAIAAERKLAAARGWGGARRRVHAGGVR